MYMSETPRCLGLKEGDEVHPTCPPFFPVVLNLVFLTGETLALSLLPSLFVFGRAP